MVVRFPVGLQRLARGSLSSALGKHAHPMASSTAESQSGRQRRYVTGWRSVETPNPDVRKFEPVMTSDKAFVDAAYKTHLSVLEGVSDVFVVGGASSSTSSQSSDHFVSVTRAKGVSWDALTPQVQELLDALKKNGADELSADESTESSASEEVQGVEADIIEVLDHRVRPTVQMDGGDVELASFDAATGEVKLWLKGACRGCPQSAVTLRETITRTLRHFVPEVKSVVAQEEEYDAEAAALDPMSDLPWEHDGEFDVAGIKALAASGSPFFSTFVGMKVEAKVMKRVKFKSEVKLNGRTPEHLIVKCKDCKVARSFEDPNDWLLASKGNTTGSACVVICPTCCVVVSL